MTSNKKDLRIPKSFDEIDPERKEYIRELAENEFYGSHPEYIYCENKEGFKKYILLDQLEKYADYSQISEEKLNKIKSSFSQKKIKSPPLSPIGLSLKIQIIKELEDTDRIRKMDAGIDVKKRSMNSTELPLYKRLPFVYIILFAFSIPVLIYLLFSKTKSGNLQIESIQNIQSIYLDSIQYTFKKDSSSGKYLVEEIPTGTHNLSINLAQRTFNSNISIATNSTLNLELDIGNSASSLKPNTTNSEKGFVYFESDANPFKTFIDNKEVEFKKEWIPLEIGEHTFRISKESYRSQPSFRSFLVSNGDSIKLRFNLIKETVKKLIVRGNLEISSNINGAKIFLNNLETPYSTDHIFNGLSEGNYSIRIEKEGYKVLNNNQKITINSQYPSAAINFKLEGNSSPIQIQTVGQLGDIFINSKKVGKGKVDQSLKFGTYEISFGKVPGYITPQLVQLNINSLKTHNITVSYFPIIAFKASLSGDKFNSTDLSFTYGYAQFNKFINDPLHGPKADIDLNNKHVLEFSYPFEYNNPKGGHAIKFKFNLPRTFSTKQNILLKLGIFYTDEDYNLVGQGQPRISLIVNNRQQLMNVTLKNKRESIAGYPTQNFKISNMLKSGTNEIILFLPNENTSFIQLSSIFIGQ